MRCALRKGAARNPTTHRAQGVAAQQARAGRQRKGRKQGARQGARQRHRGAQEGAGEEAHGAALHAKVRGVGVKKLWARNRGL